ncbi:MAG: mechanosensitive ion channel family protein [Crocosphaera sp.]
MFQINIESLIQVFTIFFIRLVVTVVIIVIGLWLSKNIHKLIVKFLNRSRLDNTVISFIRNISKLALNTIVVLVGLGNLGVRTTSIVALLGATGIAVGLALQGSLSNFAAGIILVIFRYFKVNDLIESGDIMGYVEGIRIFTTVIRTLDNREVIIPNNRLIEDKIINHYAKPERRIDLVVGVSYVDDIDKVRQIIANVLEQESRVLDKPEPKILVGELADSSVNFYVYPWVESVNYLPVKYALIEGIKKSFDVHDISIPFPQRDIHIYQN